MSLSPMIIPSHPILFHLTPFYTISSYPITPHPIPSYPILSPLVVPALVPRAELEGDMTDQQMGLQARLMSKALRKITGKCCEW